MSVSREVLTPYDLATGAVVFQENSVLAVYEKDHWGLPKGDSELGEFFLETAARETAEETGVEIEIQSLVFMSEIRTLNHRICLRRFYHAMPVADDPTPSLNNPSDGIETAELPPLAALGSMLIYRPRVEPLCDWLRGREPRHYIYSLTREPSDVEK